jgi:hypothetical protein
VLLTIFSRPCQRYFFNEFDQIHSILPVFPSSDVDDSNVCSNFLDDFIDGIDTLLCSEVGVGRTQHLSSNCFRILATWLLSRVELDVALPSFRNLDNENMSLIYLISII